MKRDKTHNMASWGFLIIAALFEIGIILIMASNVSRGMQNANTPHFLLPLIISILGMVVVSVTYSWASVVPV